MIIVFDGPDGSGKNTQTRLAIEHLLREGFHTVSLSFPQYGQSSAKLIEDYLTGNFGQADEVNPYFASLLYAIDRYEAHLKKMRIWLKEGAIIVLDRYVSSNFGHQAGKIKDLELRKMFIRWLWDLEYGKLKIPKPDITFILDVNLELAKERTLNLTDSAKLRQKSFLGLEKLDIHEKDSQHQSNARDTYLLTAKIFPKDFKVINSMSAGKQLPPEVIHERVWKQINKLISKAASPPKRK